MESQKAPSLRSMPLLLHHLSDEWIDPRSCQVLDKYVTECETTICRHAIARGRARHVHEEVIASLHLQQVSTVQVLQVDNTRDFCCDTTVHDNSQAVSAQSAVARSWSSTLTRGEEPYREEMRRKTASVLPAAFGRDHLSMIGL